MRIAFLGLGIMGSRMAANVSRAGHQLTVWNRTGTTAESFANAHGAGVAQTPREAASGAEIVITMVVDGPQVRSLLVEGTDAAIRGAAAGTLFLDCSTIGPAAAIELGAELGKHATRLVDAPVTGSSPGAQDGTLTFMVGGDPADVERAQPMFEAMGSLVVYAGPLGQGQLVKVISNAVAACNATALGQALLVGASAGADLDALVKVMAAGAGGSKMLDLKAGPMRAHDYTPLFKLDQMLKDVSLCLGESSSAGVPFPFAALAREVLLTASAMGHGEEDFASLIEALEGAAGKHL
jgi:3-hydroxyisobutyrate dehydrogenase-like beta-hydroxyacid dehydrogenase